MQLIIKIQRIIIVLYLILLNTFLAFKTIERSIPTDPKMEIYGYEYFGEYFAPTSFAFIGLIMFIAFIVKDYKDKFKDLLYVILNMGLVFSCVFYYKMLSLVGLVLVLVSIISLFLLHYKKSDISS